MKNDYFCVYLSSETEGWGGRKFSVVCDKLKHVRFDIMY